MTTDVAAMQARQQNNSGVMEVRPQHRFDVETLRAWLVEQVPGFNGPLQVAEFRGGQSNPTYRLTTPTQSYVLRRRPAGTLVPGAHAIDREARVMSALFDAGIPVPRVLAASDDPDVIGTDFYVMSLVEGRIFWDSSLRGVSRGERRQMFEEMGRIMADLHRLDPVSVGLGDFGRVGGYVPRQLARWASLYEESGERDRDVDWLLGWLRENVPESDRTAVIHGDFKCDNVVFHGAEPRVVAVLDWELSTLGDPLADFCGHALLYHLPRGAAGGLVGFSPDELSELGVPTERQYLERYAERTGRSGVESLDFYLAFSAFRLYCVMLGIRQRVNRRTAAAENALEMIGVMPELARLGRQLAERGGRVGESGRSAQTKI